MIKFFRKIRQRMIKENRVSQYLLYAIGETVLVVIGILIALQINNWNSDRIDTNKMRLVLQSIRADIQKDTTNIERGYFHARPENALINKIKDKVAREGTNLDTLIHIAKHEFSYYWVGHLKYTDDSYESIKSSGIIEKLPDELKSKLIDYYTDQLYWESIVNQTNEQYRTRFDEFTLSYSPVIGGRDEHREYHYLEDVSWQDVDPKHFNPRFKTLIDSKDIVWAWYLRELDDMKERSIDLLKDIETYLDD
jgi:hypothetical protein